MARVVPLQLPSLRGPFLYKLRSGGDGNERKEPLMQCTASGGFCQMPTIEAEGKLESWKASFTASS